MMLKLKLWYFGHLMQRTDSLEKTLMLGKMESRKKGATEDGMAGWHHRLNGHEFEQTAEDNEGQGGQVCCSPQSHKESDTSEPTEQLVQNLTAVRRHSSGAQLCPTLCDPWTAARQASLSTTNSRSSLKLTSIKSVMPSHPLSSPSPPAPNASQHQSLFQWVNSSHEVAKELEFQL